MSAGTKLRVYTEISDQSRLLGSRSIHVTVNLPWSTEDGDYPRYSEYVTECEDTLYLIDEITSLVERINNGESLEGELRAAISLIDKFWD